MSKISVIWKENGSNKGEKKLGSIRIRLFINGRTKVKSLGLPSVEKQHFNSKTQRMRLSFDKYEYYNSVIEKKLIEVKRFNTNDLVINDDEKSFIYFVRNVIIKRRVNIGTKQKFSNICNLLEEYSECKNGFKDVRFSDITTDFIILFRKWLMTERGRLNNKENTSNYKIKVFKSLLKESINEGQYNYPKNPFDGVKIRIVENNELEVLSKKDVESLLNTDIREVYRGKNRFGEIITDQKVLYDIRYERKISLSEYRDVFVFQLFGNGLRISDVLTLRWKNFVVENGNIRLKKRMVKTKKNINFKVNSRMLDIIYKFLPYKSKDTIIQCERLNEKINELRDSPISKDSMVEVKFQINSEIGSLLLGISGFEYSSRESLVRYKDDDGNVIGYMKGYISLNMIDRYTDQYKEINHFDENILGVNSKGEDGLVNLHKGGVKFDDELELLSKVRKYVEDRLDVLNKEYKDKLTNLLKDREWLIGEELLDVSYSGGDKYEDNFVFPILDDEDFYGLNDFSLMNKHQYKKFSGGRVYYNRLIKIIGQQCGIQQPLNSHLSRHSFTSLMLDFGEENLNLYDLKEVLGHSHLNTTQKYIQRFSRNKLDNLGDTFSRSFE